MAVRKRPGGTVASVAAGDPRSRGPRRRPWRRWAPLALAGLGVALAGCASDAPLDTFQPKGPEAQKIQDLQVPVFLIAGVVGLVVLVVTLLIIVRFRRRKGHEGDVPTQIHGAPRLEVMWTIAPAVLLAFVAVFTVKTLFDLAKTPNDPLHVTVIGQQWWWEFQYPDVKDTNGLPIVTANEMVVPAGKAVALDITSRDVIHSFWIPALNGKRDAVPGRVQPLNIEADAPGEFYGQCTEFCGLAHAKMRMRVVALSQPDYDAWVANQLKPAADAPANNTEAVAGETLFKSQCARCHTINGLRDANGQLIVSQANEQLVSGAAPNLTHLMSRTVFAGATYNLKRPDCTGDLQGLPTGTPVECLNSVTLSAWLRNPPALIPMDAVQNADGKYRGMPNLGLSEPQIAQLVAYLATLK
jgi:cytochrome c oxidase subunit II